MFTFKKKERLLSPIAVQKVRLEGQNHFSFPFKAYYIENEEEQSRVVFSVPKRIFKRAVVRNLLKRRAKEAYRLNKHQDSEKTYDILFVYSHSRIVDYGKIEQSIKAILEKVS